MLFFFSRAVKLLRINGIPGSRCLSLKVKFDSVPSLLMPKGEETPEQEDQDFQGSLVLSASSSRIKQQLRTDESTVGILYLSSEFPVGSLTPALL